MKLGLAAWHRYMMSGDAALLDELVADDAVFHSPVVHTPQAGREKVLMYLTAAGQVFGNGTFRYVRELVDGPEACLEFECEMDGVKVNGVVTPSPVGPAIENDGAAAPPRPARLEPLTTKMVQSISFAIFVMMPTSRECRTAVWP